MAKQKQRKNKKVRGFKMNNKTGHVSLAYGQKGRKVKSIGFTHDGDQSKESKSKLTHNIDPDDSAECYAKNKVEVGDVKDYKDKSKYKKYRIHIDDQMTIEIIKHNGNNKKR